MTTEELLELYYALDVEVDTLDAEYIYGARDIVGWLAVGAPEDISRLRSTNSRLFELLTEVRAELAAMRTE